MTRSIILIPACSSRYGRSNGLADPYALSCGHKYAVSECLLS
jgi:hypothetical protein